MSEEDTVDEPNSLESSPRGWNCNTLSGIVVVPTNTIRHIMQQLWAEITAIYENDITTVRTIKSE